MVADLLHVGEQPKISGKIDHLVDRSAHRLLAKRRSGELSCIGKPYLGASVNDLTIDDRIRDHRDTKALQDHGKRDFCHHHGKRSANRSARSGPNGMYSLGDGSHFDQRSELNFSGSPKTSDVW